MKQPTFCGRELLPLSVIEAVRVGDPLAVESVLRYYDGYMNKLCTRTLCDLDGLPHVRVDEHMKDRLQAKLTEVIVNKKQQRQRKPSRVEMMNCTPKVGHTDQRLEVQFYGKRTFHRRI